MASAPAPASVIVPCFPLSRDHFPHGFTFGSASASFQYESALDVGGRGPSIWDTYCVEKGLDYGKAIDQYHRYEEDVSLMKWMGLDAYRFSISWSRLLPKGKKSGGVNPEGVKYYHKLIDELHANGIEPYVTLFHWDVPLALEEEYGGFLRRDIVQDFKDYADLCFMEYGNKVKYWLTLNEPWTFCEGGYASGTLAPGRGNIADSSLARRESHTPTMFSFNPRRPKTLGNPATEPYLVAHHLLLAHAEIFHLYKDRYQIQQGGKIGLALNSIWLEPLNPYSREDADAKSRGLDFTLNWFLDPVLTGHYPKVVEEVLKSRGLPIFTERESNMLRHSLNYLGANYYTSTYVRDASKNPPSGPPSYITDPKVEYPRKFFLGDDWGAVDWLKIYPQGILEFLRYIKSKYKGPIYITENGYGEKHDESLTLNEALHDEKRVNYHHQHFCYMLQAINQYKVDIQGYFAWSLMDNFEWSSGYDVRFGIIYIDFKDDLKRHPKYSAQWFKSIIRRISHSSGGLIDLGSSAQYILLAAKTDGLLELENGSAEEAEPLQAKKKLVSYVNSDPVLGSVNNQINSIKI